MGLIGVNGTWLVLLTNKSQKRKPALDALVSDVIVGSMKTKIITGLRPRGYKTVEETYSVSDINSDMVLVTSFQCDKVISGENIYFSLVVHKVEMVGDPEFRIVTDKLKTICHESFIPKIIETLSWFLL